MDIYIIKYLKPVLSCIQCARKICKKYYHLFDGYTLCYFINTIVVFWIDFIFYISSFHFHFSLRFSNFVNRVCILILQLTSVWFQIVHFVECKITYYSIVKKCFVFLSKGPKTGQYSPGQRWPLQTGRFWHVQRGYTWWKTH